MATLYTIKGWDSLYENAGSRKIRGSLDWFPLPTKHDGLSYGRLMRRSDGMEMYAAWVLILAVAAKCPTRGTLANGEGPLSADDIATKTRTSESVIKRALQLFSSKEIPWLSTSTLPDSPDDLALQDRTRQDITGQDRTEPDKTEPDQEQSPAGTAVDLVDSFERFWSAFPAGRKHAKAKARSAWSRAITKADPGVIIEAAVEYAASPVGQGEYVKGPEPWLNGECWNDDRAAWYPRGVTISDKTRMGVAAKSAVLDRLFPQEAEHGNCN